MRTILFHGGASNAYWGSHLERDESSYVLQIEFGADAAVDMSSVGPHADYIAAFLPADNIVLVAEPIRNDLGLALAAAQEVREIYGARAPDDLVVVEALLRQANGPAPSAESLEHVRARIQLLLSKVAAIRPVIPAELQRRLDAHHLQHCPTESTECYLEEGKRTMRRVDPELMKTVYDVASDGALEPMVAERFLRLAESQLPKDPETMSERIGAHVARIRKLGFKVIRVPHLYSPEIVDDWPGISYANSLLFEKTLFVPAAGLGKYEERIFREMQKKLPKGYELVPVYARFGLMNNGGVHCVFGIVREAGED